MFLHLSVDYFFFFVDILLPMTNPVTHSLRSTCECFSFAECRLALLLYAFCMPPLSMALFFLFYHFLLCTYVNIIHWLQIIRNCYTSTRRTFIPLRANSNHLFGWYLRLLKWSHLEIIFDIGACWDLRPFCRLWMEVNTIACLWHVISVGVWGGILKSFGNILRLELIY